MMESGLCCLKEEQKHNDREKKSRQKKGVKNRLKPISFYGHKPEDVIRAFMKVDPKKVKKREDEEKRQDALEAEQANG